MHGRAAAARLEAIDVVRRVHHSERRGPRDYARLSAGVCPLGVHVLDHGYSLPVAGVAHVDPCHAEVAKDDAEQLRRREGCVGILAGTWAAWRAARRGPGGLKSQRLDLHRVSLAKPIPLWCIKPRVEMPTVDEDAEGATEDLGRHHLGPHAASQREEVADAVPVGT